MSGSVVVTIGASTGTTEQLLNLVGRKLERPTWQAVRRQVRRERKIIRALRVAVASSIVSPRGVQK